MGRLYVGWVGLAHVPVEAHELTEVQHVLLHGEFALTRHPVSEGDGHINHSAHRRHHVHIHISTHTTFPRTTTPDQKLAYGEDRIVATSRGGMARARGHEGRGTSSHFLQRQRTIISSPILNPMGLQRAFPLARMSLEMQKKPDIGSVQVVRGSARTVAPMEMICEERKTQKTQTTQTAPERRETQRRVDAEMHAWHEPETRDREALREPRKDGTNARFNGPRSP